MAAPSRTGFRCAIRTALLALAAAALCGPFGPASAQGGKAFDHLTTGFPLTGQHQLVRCEECHLRGIFKGTQAQCAACHTPGTLVTAVMIPGNHIPTPEPCDTCHSTASFFGARFPHAAVIPGACVSCHNGVNSTGKNAGHIATTASCDVCHSTVSFQSNFAVIPLGHIPTSLACSNCHSPSQFTPATMNHAGIAGNCTQCHAAGPNAIVFTIQGTANINGHPVTLTANGQPVVETVKPEGAGHIPTSSSCELCHAASLSTFASFTGGVMSHAGISKNCASCHAAGLSFTGVTNLVTTATHPAHIPLTAGQDCSVCHSSTTAFGPGTVMNHAGITGGCNACHEAGLSFYNVASLVVRPSPATDPNHPATGDCSQCHGSTTSFTTSLAMPSNHMPVPSSMACATCHTNSANYATYTMVHAGLTASCATCHATGTGPFAAGTGFAIKQTVANHLPIPTGQDCKVCHASTTTFGPGTAMNHVNMTSGCAACHTAGMSWFGVTVVTSATHPTHVPIPGSEDCSTCHSPTTYTAFGPGTTMNHAGITGGCNACHESGLGFYNIANLVTRPTSVQDPVHPTTGDCSQCHSGFTAGAFNKVTVLPAGHMPNPAGTACSVCHTTSGSYTSYTMGASGHAGIASGCTTCHEAGLSFLNLTPATLVQRPAAASNGITPADSNHPASGDCVQCHSGFTAGAFNTVTAAPSNHMPVPSSMACATCHTTSGNYAAYTMVHTGLTASCATCHGAGTGPFAAAAGFTIKLTPTGSPAHFPIPSGEDCKVCHASTTSFGPGTAMNHVNLTSACATCHAAGMSWVGVTIVTSATHPAHVPLPGSDDCSTCHSPTTYTAFGPGTSMNHAGITSGCASCHEAGLSYYNITNLVTRPSATQDPVHPATGDCSQCHTGFTAGAFNNVTTLPAGHMPNPAGTACATCHTTPGSYTSYTMGAAGHAGITTSCVTCHEAGLSFLNLTPSVLMERPAATANGITPADSAHPASGDCSSCHSGFTAGAFSNVTALPANHMPNPAGTACATCHTTSGSYSTYTMGAAGHAGITTGCAACHEAGLSFAAASAWSSFVMERPAAAANGMTPADSVHPASGDCSTCHSGFTAGAFSNVTALPAGHMPNPAGTACATCHTTAGNYAVYTMGATGHAGISSSCATCHEAGKSFLNLTPSTLMERPAATANGITPADSAHPASGDCASCHSGFTAGAFSNVTALPAGHMPNPAGTACTVCHTTSGNYTVYTMGAAGHAGITSGCTACHEAGVSFTATASAWNSFVIERPTASANGITPADSQHPATGDCMGCHTGFTAGAFNTAVAKPAGHVNSGSMACATCHTTGAFNVYVMSHTGVVGTCGSCHGSAGSGTGYVGPFAGVPLPGGGTYTAGQMGMVPKSYPTTSPAHIPIPTGEDCNVCHASTTAFGPGTAMNHTGITSGCASCHAAGMAWYGVTIKTPTGLSPAHVPYGTTACETCHSATTFTSFSGTKVPHAAPFMVITGTQRSSSAVSNPTCKSCHGPSGQKWYGVSLSTATVGSHQGSSTSQDCVNCHTTTSMGGSAAAARAPITTLSKIASAASAAASGKAPGKGITPVTPVPGTSRAAGVSASTTAAAGAFSHVGVIPRTCATCHRAGGSATAKPANHLATALSCDLCHRTTAWLPAVFAHGSVTGTCASCHFPGGATAKPASHFLTGLACDSCHRSTATWLPATYAHITPAFTPHMSSVRCIDCHITNSSTVIWKFPMLKPGCAGCHGPTFSPTSGKKSIGAPVGRPK